MNRTEWRRWFRSSPWIGGLGGLLLAAYVHVFGHVPERKLHLGDWLLRELHVAALFDASPLLGYVTLVTLGVVSGWLFRRFEDRYVFPE
jgi:hypothetical protein